MSSFHQRRIQPLHSCNLTGDNWHLQDYIACGGYAQQTDFKNKIAPETVIAEIKASGLRGRGGRDFLPA